MSLQLKHWLFESRAGEMFLGFMERFAGIKVRFNAGKARQEQDGKNGRLC